MRPKYSALTAHFFGFDAAHCTFSLECIQQVLRQPGNIQLVYDAQRGTTKEVEINILVCRSLVEKR